MKKTLILFTIIFFFLTVKADAAIGSLGLIIEGGKTEISMQKGEKKWLFVRNGFSGLPCFKGLTFFSDNTVVATVGLHTGLLRANSYGTANISVTDEAGENGIIRVKVTAIKEKPSLLPFIPILALGFSGFVLISKKR
ncbi:MAG: Ig-like domain-containing protein [Clostridia bacterium]|nr:Ig-like domain-containing protein [Clostridia bacterium]